MLLLLLLLPAAAAAVFLSYTHSSISYFFSFFLSAVFTYVYSLDFFSLSDLFILSPS